MEFDVLIGSSRELTVALFLYLCDSIQRDHKQLESPMNYIDSSTFCVGRNIGLSEACSQIGFDAQNVHMVDNKILFGVSSKNIEINALCLNTNKCMSFTGPSSYSVDSNIAYSHHSGLVFVAKTKSTNSSKIIRVEFNTTAPGKFRQKSLTMMPYHATDCSLHVINDGNKEKLIVCGGLVGGTLLPACSLYNFENGQWTDLEDMNHYHQCAGICEWKERGNKVIVAGGCNNNKYVEEYDMHQNRWVGLPQLNGITERYPAVFTSSNILFCITTQRKSSQPSLKRRRLNSNLSAYERKDLFKVIELYDPRDRNNKWLTVGTVQEHFNLPKDTKNWNHFAYPL